MELVLIIASFVPPIAYEIIQVIKNKEGLENSPSDQS